MQRTPRKALGRGRRVDRGSMPVRGHDPDDPVDGRPIFSDGFESGERPHADDGRGLLSAVPVRGTAPGHHRAPTTVGYGGSFAVDTDRADDIADVVLIRPSTVTHGVNFDQRSVSLSFAAQTGDLSVDAPSSSVKAPPGWYMMFLVDDTGVPSIASWVRVA